MRNVVFFLVMTSTSFGQQVPNLSSLSLQEIMKGHAFVGNLPENLRWSADGKQVLFDWNPSNEAGNSTYGISVTVPNPQPVKINASDNIANDPLQNAHALAYYSIDGALICHNKKTKKKSLVFQTSEALHSVQRVKDENHVYFIQGNNLFRYDVLAGSIQQITNFKKGKAPKEKTDTSLLEKEELKHFRYFQDLEKKKAWNEKQVSSIYTFPEAYYMEDLSISNIQIASDERFVTFRLTSYPEEKETEFQHYLSKDGHAYTEKARAKVAENDPSHRLAIYSIAADSVYFVDFSKLQDIRKKPTYLNDTTPYTQDRKICMHRLKFSEQSSTALCDVRSYDNKDRWILLIDLTNGAVKEIDRQYDEAWIGGPGISGWNEEEGTLGWIDTDRLYFQSEVTGYSHLYLHSLKNNKTTPLSSGKWEVHKVILSTDHKKFYVSANRSHPGNRDFLSIDIATVKITDILTKDGYHDVEISPDEKTLAVRYSYSNLPWEVYLAQNTPSTTLKRITFSTTPAFNQYKWRAPENITFTASDGVDVHARLYKPTKASNQAAVIFVHGAGYLQNAHHYWSNYFREYMFHHLLTDNGVTVLDIDYRASEGYGRDYRTAIYRHMGGRDLQDHIDGKRLLVEMGIDSNRVGIYGGSYGGFISLMALFQHPGTFACGAALRAVTDWAHYNNEYTSNILNYPETDPEAYRKSSPIYFAEGLQDPLLLLHGMIDDNVQFQDIVRLHQKLIELGKQDWELAVYPIERHSFKEAYSWYDEYRRIYELFYHELIQR